MRAACCIRRGLDEIGLGQAAAASRTVNMRPWLIMPHAVRHREQLVMIGRDQDDRLAGSGQPVDEAVDRDLGADVDALRRLVEDEEFRPGEQPAADDDLLLVAARESADLLGAAAGEIASSRTSRRSSFLLSLRARSGRFVPSLSRRGDQMFGNPAKLKKSPSNLRFSGTSASPP